MRSIFRATTFAALGLTLALAACGDDSDASGHTPADHPAGLLTAGSFDTSSADYETSNLMFALQEAGYPLDTTSAIDSTSIAQLIAGKDIVFFPEVTPSFETGTMTILKAFVDHGGTLVLVGGYTHFEWVNTAFGWELDQGEDWNDEHPMPRTGAADDTPYGPGPSSIPANDGGVSVLASSLPTNAITAYQASDASEDGSVVVLPSGDGRVVYFGWDWYDGAPFGGQDGGWSTLLTLTAGF